MSAGCRFDVKRSPLCFCFLFFVRSKLLGVNSAKYSPPGHKFHKSRHPHARGQGLRKHIFRKSNLIQLKKSLFVVHGFWRIRIVSTPGSESDRRGWNSDTFLRISKISCEKKRLEMNYYGIFRCHMSCLMTLDMQVSVQVLVDFQEHFLNMISV